MYGDKFAQHVASHELPASDHGGGDTVALDIVVVEHKVYVDNHEQHEGPHEEVVDVAHHKEAVHAEEHPCGSRLGHIVGGDEHHHEARGDLYERQEEESEIGSGSQRVVAYVIDGMFGQQQYVDLEGLEYTVPLAARHWHEVLPVGEVIARKGPVHSKGYVDGK